MQGNMSRNPPSASSALVMRHIINDEEYASNQARLHQLQGILDTWVASNEQGHNDYRRVQEELVQCVEAGEKAKCVYFSTPCSMKRLRLPFAEKYSQSFVI